MSATRPAPNHISAAVLGVGALLAALSLFTANPLLTASAVVVLTLVVLLLWQPEEPPALLFVCVIQWFQASAKVLNADVLGLELYKLPAAHHLGIAAADTVERAAGLSLVWVLVGALGMRLALWGVRARQDDAAQRARSVDLWRLFLVYVAWTGVMLVLGVFARGGLRQLLVALADLRWSVVFVLFWTLLRSPGRRSWLALIFLVEVVAGFLSFFASFRTPVFLLAIAMASGPVRFRPRQVIGFAVVGMMALYLGVVWSAIKTDYRATLNRGSGQQIIEIDRETQIEELLRLFGAVDRDTLADGFERLVDRVAYIDYFAYCLEHVPALQPHEDGRLWREAVAHVLQPRILFPDKPALESDTRVAERYTGLDLMSWTETTSVALGMPGEAYVDFGFPFMFAAAVWIGLLCGWIQRYVAAGGRFGPLREGLAVALLLPLAGIESSTTKFLGGYLTRLLVGWVLWRTVVPTLTHWVMSRAGSPATRAAPASPPLPRRVAQP